MYVPKMLMMASLGLTKRGSSRCGFFVAILCVQVPTCIVMSNSFDDIEVFEGWFVRDDWHAEPAGTRG